MEIREIARQNLSQLVKSRDVYRLTKLLFDVELTPMQIEIVRLIAYDEHPRVLIVCMTRYGKSFCTSIALLLWILMNKGKRLVIVAPTNDKTTIIRNHMANFISHSPLFTSLLDIDRTGFEKIRKEVSKKRMTWKNGVEMRTLTAEGEGAALMGFGGDKLVVDEECDIKFEVYRSKLFRMLGDNPDSTYVGIGNPWHRDNQMHQHWLSPDWLKIHIDYKIALREGRIAPDFVTEQENQITPREFQVLYKAEFPEESEDQLILLEWIKKAVRDKPKDILSSEGEQRMSIDVARFGNDLTVFTKGKKFKSLYIVDEIEQHSKEDTMTTVGRARQMLNKDKEVKRICVDTDGLGGGVSDRLQELKNEGEITPRIVQFHGGKGVIGEEEKKRFLNQKAQAYFHLRRQFEKGNIIIPNHPKLIDQLSKMKWMLSSSNKIKILDPGEAADDTSEKKSPDFADSLCYFTWDLESRVITIV